ncbi:Glucose-6-phosphate isomerase, archaeal [hydrothermal vent metagenome]|uniref:glucose-6-phosphate isomerase n=1 Tax=hydrothermal vent metagenome TaxID=652676 RepID=A0A3B1BDW9_9ZZZZ
MNEIIEPKVNVEIESGNLKGEKVIEITKRLRDLENIFSDEHIRKIMEPNTIVYEVQAHMPVEEGTTAGLFFGTTIIHPGKVGDEYFMTKGHLHKKSDRAEYYWGIEGEGMLLLMDKDRNTWAEKMHKGSLHYIDADVAHRTVNIGDGKLIFGACWPSDAGHNYDEILMNGFSARLIEKDGKPILVSEWEIDK